MDTQNIYSTIVNFIQAQPILSVGALILLAMLASFILTVSDNWKHITMHYYD